MRTLDDCLHAMGRVTGTESKVIMERGVVVDSAENMRRMRDALRLFVDVPEKLEEEDFIPGVARMRRAFAAARAALKPSS